MKRLSHLDGSWGNVLLQWSKECHSFDEDFENYLPETLRLLGSLVEDTEGERWDGVYGYEKDKNIQGICFVNGAFIPGYTGRVLRVRHVILSPKYDFGEFEEQHFGETLGSLFEGILSLTDSVIPCAHLKFHFRSPADVALFQKFSQILAKNEHFSSVMMRGAWLMLTKG